jgi:hypothetical protein
VASAVRAAEKEGRESELPNVSRRRMKVSDVPLPRCCCCGGRGCAAPEIPLPLGGGVVEYERSESVNGGSGIVLGMKAGE